MDGLVPGRIVYYVLSADDVTAITRRRTTGNAIRVGLQAGTWPVGAQAHIGNAVAEGDVLPAQVVKVWNDDTGASNLKVNLDGSDTFWATTRDFNAAKTPGTWHWMR